MNISKKNIILIILHFLVLTTLFTNRYPIADTYNRLKEWDQTPFADGITGALKLYFSDPTDETYYYEWSTVVLEKTFDTGYPFEQRAHSKLAPYFHLAPQKHIPYLNLEFEYPPTLILPILLPRIFSDSHTQYVKIFALQQCLLYFLCLYLVYKILKSKLLKTSLAFEKILFYSLLSLLFLGQLFVTRLDLVVSLITLLAFYYLIQKKLFTANFWICIGAITKGFPIFFLPIIFIQLFKLKKYTSLAGHFVLSFLLIAGVNFALAYFTEGKYWETFQYHAERGFQIESTYALIPYLSHLFFDTVIWTYNSHGCTNITMPFFLNSLKGYTNIISILLIAAVYLRFLLKKNLSPENILRLFLALILAFILTFKALSPQFLIWLIPLIFISWVDKIRIIKIFLATLLLTQVIFPNIFHELMTGNWIAIILLSLRNFILIFLFINFFKSIDHENISSKPTL